ncbi:HDOD domain-containing protein [Kaarinaea lacus]
MEVNLNQLQIPKASAYAAKALEIVSSESPDMKALEHSIMHDPLLASSILRYANSPLNRRATQVTNIPTALKLLGLKSVRSAIVSAAIRSFLPTDSSVGQVILSHMVEISMLCKLIAAVVCPTERDDLEFLGLVHDVGMLTLAANFTETYEELINTAKNQNTPIDELEKQTLNICHSMVSARTAQEFRLPQSHIELLRHFHHHQVALKINDERDRDTCILALAHLIRNQIPNIESTLLENITETIPQMQQALHLTDEQLASITAQATDLLQNNAQQTL